MKKVLLLGTVALSLTLTATAAYTMLGGNPTTGEMIYSNAADTTGPAGAYSFDVAHSAIGFKVKHMGLVDVPGYFREFEGAINYDPADVAKSSVNFTAKAASVDTGNDRRDGHLKTADFFEVEKYPSITFKSTKIEKKGSQWMVTGDFTIKDVTKQISFPFNVAGFVKQQNGSAKMGVTGETSINRREYNVKYGNNLPDGTPQLSDDIRINLQIEANLPGPKPPAAPAAAAAAPKTE